METNKKSTMSKGQYNELMDFFLDAWENARKQHNICDEGVTSAVALVTNWIEARASEGIEVLLKSETKQAHISRNQVHNGLRALKDFTGKQALYRGLIMELRQLLRDHYAMRYLHCRARDLPALYAKFGVERSTPREIEDAQRRQGWSGGQLVSKWSGLIREIDRERNRTVEWNKRYALYDEPGYFRQRAERPPKPRTPFSKVARIIFDLCHDTMGEEDDWECLLGIIREQTSVPRDYNPYTSLIWWAQWTQLAKRIEHDDRFLHSRLSRPGDARLWLLVEQGIEDMSLNTFAENARVHPLLNRWRVRPRDAARGMAYFAISKGVTSLGYSEGVRI
ncbi:hypothetical protein CSIM01_06728 [Colletotrichum simmondsii]|uniref:Uncharacterized protein n=1 Tax=Colletotrichum simmondsii TaxID=703756 RepID=A0A135RW28_9PEZI|nr:hypothetical protein CSIM01_06728 [Colletotrichum simmondsii]